jgi:hypothetical protein
MGNRLTIALAVFVLIVVPLASYTAGYLLLPEVLYSMEDGWVYYNELPADHLLKSKASLITVERIYPQQWLKTSFQPASKLEGWLRRVEVQATWEGEYPVPSPAS